MPYKISGTTNENSRVIVIKQSDWSLEKTQSGLINNFEIDGLLGGNKLVITRNDLGDISAFGNINPLKYGGDVGVFGGGYPGLSDIDTITISTTGNATYFGSFQRSHMGTCSNGTNDRGLFGPGATAGVQKSIYYITFSTPGNAVSFGNGTIRRYMCTGTSNNTDNRGIFGGGTYDGSSGYNVLDYVTISTLGNATDYGDLPTRRFGLGATSNGTSNRGVFMGGYHSGTPYSIIEYVTISTTGNASNFGNMSSIVYYFEGLSNLTNDRGLIAGGFRGGFSSVNNIDYITISSLGNSTDFGDLTFHRYKSSTASNGTDNRGVFAGGEYGDGSSDPATNVMDYVNIASVGNAADFGDLRAAKSWMGGMSNGA